MSSSTGNLSAWLSNNKARFLEDLKKDGAKSWTIAMGNEAGDLDSCASAIAYSYLTPKKPSIGLIQTLRHDLYLRPENLYAFKLAKLAEDYSDLLTIDDIPIPLNELSSSFALVDHNSLLPQFVRPFDSPHGPSIVNGIVDHHEDENQHLDANPRRIVVPLGSCASLIADTFKDTLFPADPTAANSLQPPPVELAILLLTAIYIDTNGLKEGGKAEKIDFTSANLLESYGSSIIVAGGHDFVLRKGTTKALKAFKGDVSHLNSRDLLRRDYKQYAFTSADGTPINVGLSTVPLGTKAWLEKDPEGYRAALEAWATERRLEVVGVLNTFKNQKDHKERQILILVGGAKHDKHDTSTAARLNVESLTNALSEGLEANPSLRLEPVDIKGDYKHIKGPLGKHTDPKEYVGQVRFWKQLNTNATRKVIAPAVKAIIEKGKGFADLSVVD
ncbi:uncharacterized protein EI90DRAFT_2911431 [Cantharellus anzutake]|uniref:uncharacterized protein n=1 Tax=Cantharellus anzutake TaxID=1750568 RepID=UPI001908857A|nr:uncharacterized protein EI90DRAFT_2911431 [Cantharellus anzutake]KAF8336270.1 hypothetical protein EI90DRAFT_2911431 [Cantharellus anzutake]